MDDGRMWTGIIVVVIFLLFKAFISACETALIEVNDAKVKKLSESGDKKAIRLTKLLSKPTKLITSLSILKVLATVVITFFIVEGFYEKVKIYILQEMIKNETASALLAIIFLILVTTAILVTFSSTIPRNFARKKIEKFPYAISSFVNFLVVIVTPFERIITCITFIFCKILGLSSDEGKDAVTQEEILMMVDVVNETGEIEESQKEMITNIFEFDDLTASEVMTHRTEVIAVDVHTDLKELAQLAHDEGLSRIPVYENTIDTVVGVVYAKDLLTLVGNSNYQNYCIKDYIHDVMYIPETKQCDDLFKDFTSKKSHIAVVVDEYGGTAGIVTMEDLLESIVGNIQDEYDDEVEEIVKLSDNEYRVLGNANPDEVLETLNLHLPEEHDYDTIGGFVIDLLGFIPHSEESTTNVSVDFENVTFTVLSTIENKIDTLKIKVNNED